MSITSTAASTTLCLSLSTAPLSPSEEDTVGSHSCFFLTFLQSSWSSRGGNRDDGCDAGAGGGGVVVEGWRGASPNPSYFYC